MSGEGTGDNSELIQLLADSTVAGAASGTATFTRMNGRSNKQWKP
jgi:hypothetical protein